MGARHQCPNEEGIAENGAVRTQLRTLATHFHLLHVLCLLALVPVQIRVLLLKHFSLPLCHLVQDYLQPLRDPKLNESRANKIFGLFRDRIRALSPSEFQNLLRPAFREDELTLIILGGLTGFLAGWLHLVLVFFPMAK